MSIYKNGQKVLGSIITIDDNHIKEVANADRNIKTYTTLEQLGLVLGSETLEDIATNLPDNSIFIFTVSSSSNTSIYPYENGILIVEKLNNYRVNFRFYKDNAVEPWGNYYNINSSTCIGWQRVCTTTIEDVSTTSVATQNLGEGYVSYNIINGICTIALNSIKVTSNAIQYITTEAINLPAQAINNSWYQIFSTSGDVGFVRVVDGKIQTFNNFDTTKNYHGTFSYKVVEN